MNLILGGLLIIFLVDGTHPVNPINSVLLFPFGKSFSFFGVVSLYFLTSIKRNLLHLLDFRFKFLIFVLKLMKFFRVVGRAVLLLINFFLNFLVLFFNVAFLFFELLDFFLHALLVNFKLLLQLS
jgi:hypothetical protein